MQTEMAGMLSCGPQRSWRIVHVACARPTQLSYDMTSGFFARPGIGRRPALSIAHSDWRGLATDYVLPLWYWAWAVFFAWTSLCAIVNFSWRQPMSDEFVNYQDFLKLSFPQNALQSGNGHRPIFPNLVIVAAIAWFRGNHWLQFVVGLACAAA